MGAIKRASELLIKRLNGRNGTLFSAVRFGNVLGSRGSLVPIFQTWLLPSSQPTIVSNETTAGEGIAKSSHARRPSDDS